MELLPRQPTFVASNSASPDGCQASIQVSLADIQETDPAGAAVPGRSAASVLRHNVSWATSNPAVGVPAVDAVGANFSMPLLVDLPPCPGTGATLGALLPASRPGGVSLQALLVGGDTNFSLAPAPAVELLAGNVKFGVFVDGW